MLAALAAHTAQAGVPAAMDKAVGYLAGVQCEDGGFISWVRKTRTAP
jgi:hypothetical protein